MGAISLYAYSLKPVRRKVNMRVISCTAGVMHYKKTPAVTFYHGRLRKTDM